MLQSADRRGEPLSTPLPTASRLEATARRLAGQDETRRLVALVEQWAHVGDPTPAARLLQVEALLDLCLMDRAWARLQAISADGPWELQRQRLIARMFVERGWPKRAQKVIDRALDAHPDDEALHQLAERAREPARRAPSDLPAPEAPYEEHVAAAEAYLATGAFLKARRLLDQLVKHHPDDARIADLRWGLQGDYALDGLTLDEMLSRFGAPETGYTELPDLDEEGDPTEAVPLDLGGSGTVGSFPSMFGGHGADPSDPLDEAEITQSTDLSALREELEASRREEPAPDDDEDTQVLRVVDLEAAHRRGSSLPDADPDDSPPSSPGLADGLEGEDDAVVVLTRRRGRQPPQEIRAPLPAPDPGPSRRRRPPSSTASLEQATPAPVAAAPTASSPPDRRTRTLQLALLAAAALGGLGGVVALLAALSAS